MMKLKDIAEVVITNKTKIITTVAITGLAAIGTAWALSGNVDEENEGEVVELYDGDGQAVEEITIENSEE